MPVSKSTLQCIGVGCLTINRLIINREDPVKFIIFVLVAIALLYLGSLLTGIDMLNAVIELKFHWLTLLYFLAALVLSWIIVNILQVIFNKIRVKMIT